MNDELLFTCFFHLQLEYELGLAEVTQEFGV